MGKFAEIFGNEEMKKQILPYFKNKHEAKNEMTKFIESTGVDMKHVGLGVTSARDVAIIGNLAHDKNLTFLEKLSKPFQLAFKAMLTYEKKRQVKVISEFFDDMVKIGHESIKLRVKQEGDRDHMIEFDGSGQWGPLNGQIAINGKTNAMKAKFALEAMKQRGYKTITVYLKTKGSDDHYVELNESGERIPFLKKIKEL